MISLALVPCANTHRDRFMACAAATHRGRRGQLLFRERSTFFSKTKQNLEQDGGEANRRTLGGTRHEKKRF